MNATFLSNRQQTDPTKIIYANSNIWLATSIPILQSRDTFCKPVQFTLGIGKSDEASSQPMAPHTMTDELCTPYRHITDGLATFCKIQFHWHRTFYMCLLKIRTDLMMTTQHIPYTYWSPTFTVLDIFLSTCTLAFGTQQKRFKRIHMRMVKCYSNKTKLMLYSESWQNIHNRIDNRSQKLGKQ